MGRAYEDTGMMTEWVDDGMGWWRHELMTVLTRWRLREEPEAGQTVVRALSEEMEDGRKN